MTEKQLEIALENARANFARITDRVPPRLAKMEATLSGKIAKHKGNSFAKLEALYAAMDELYAFANKYTACNKGCNHCCYYNVSVRELEVQYIEKTVGIKRKSFLLPAADFHGTPCPFLKNGACSIYKSRPFVCRRHVSLCETPTWCHVDKCNTQEFPLLNFSEVDISFSMIISENRLSESIDIRQVFGNN